LEDALRSIVYLDDAQIVDLDISKRYATEAEPPGVVVRVGELGPWDE
jgi:Holliday junction resolvase RusA-like endonuclease